jgi:Trehalase
VDTNVGVAVGAERTAEIASSLGRNEEASHYRLEFQSLSDSINRYLWDEEDGTYYAYDLRAARRMRRLMLSTFNPLRLAIAPARRVERLLKRLVDPSQFNWGKIPLTTLAMTETDYKATLRQGPESPYNFIGDVWAQTNAPILVGLQESGRFDLAAQLNWDTIRAFNGNYRETLLPFSGQGIGDKRYGESASVYIQSVIERLFGVDFDAIQRRIRIAPLVPKALYGRTIHIKGLILPTNGNTRLSVEIKQSSAKNASITVDVDGLLPEYKLEVALPGLTPFAQERIGSHQVFHFH